MGYHLTWIAVEGGDPATLLDRLGLVACGTTNVEVDGDYACAVLPGGWFVVVSGQMRLALDALLPRVSAAGRALGGMVEERVMVSRLAEFRDGQQAWDVVHDPDVDFGGVQVTGEPPEPFEAIREELAAELAAAGSEDVDYMFDVPVRLGQRLCGYAPDEPQPVEWTVLEPADPGRPAREAPQLAARVRSELVPWLESLDWRKIESRPHLEFELERVVDDDHQTLIFQWRDDPTALWIDIAFIVRSQADPDVRTKLRGRVRQEPAPSFWRRLGDRLFARPRPKPSYGERVDEMMRRTRDQLLAVERLLKHGERDERLAVEVWDRAA